VTDGPGAAVAARLRQLAAHGHVEDRGTGTAELAVALDRRRRQRVGRGTAAVVAVLVLGAAATLARPADVTPAAAPELPADVTSAGAAPDAVVRATPPARTTAAPPALYEQPARGSLAGDAGFLAGVAALPWSAPMDPNTGNTWEIEPDSRRVVYAADVPGGHRWAVVLARWRQQWAANWFAGPAGASPAELTEADAPTTFSPTEPLALMDVSAPTAPLLVLTGPGVTAEWSSSLDRAADGSLVRDFDPLPVVDGAMLGEVATPVGWNAGELFGVQEGIRSQVYVLRFTGTAAWDSVYASSGPPDDALFAACLSAHGFSVQDPPETSGVSWSDPREQQLTSVEAAARLQEAMACQAEAGG
jgi:hypothetical protein